VDTVKKIKNLLVGDGSEKNCQIASSLFHDDAIHLLDNTNFNNIDPTLSYHTSLKDLDIENLLTAIDISSNVQFGVFEFFANYIEELLINSLLYEKNVLAYNNLLGDSIDLNKNEIVFLGCSHTQGGAIEKNQRFSYLVSQHLGLEERNLAVGATGLWQMHNTFFRCNFNKNQKVVLQLSDPYRFNYFKNQTIVKESFKNSDDKKLVLTYQDGILSYQEYSLLNSIISSSKKQQIDLVCFRMSNELPVEYNHTDYLMASTGKYFAVGKWLDYGTDNQHSGPLTHKKIASIIVKKFKGNK